MHITPLLLFHGCKLSNACLGTKGNGSQKRSREDSGEAEEDSIQKSTRRCTRSTENGAGKDTEDVCAGKQHLWLYYFVSGLPDAVSIVPIGFLGLHEIPVNELPEFPFFPYVRDGSGAAEQKLQSCRLQCAGRLKCKPGVLSAPNTDTAAELHGCFTVRHLQTSHAVLMVVSAIRVLGLSQVSLKVPSPDY